MIETTKIDFVLDMLEMMQSELEVLTIDEMYDILEDVIIILAMEDNT